MSRAILSLFASKCPKDWIHTDKNVISHNIFVSSDKPNLHHIFPINYIQNNPGTNSLNKDSLMNIAYLTNYSNLQISDKSPLDYILKLDENKEFETILKNHLVPKVILSWARTNTLPEDALDQFIELRVENIIEELKNILEGVNFDVIDTKELD